MRAVKSRNTAPERKLRAMLAGMKLSGWRQHDEQVLGKPDVTFPKLKIAVFVDGCFWHGCPICKRPLPQQNRDYWGKKIARNVARDAKYNDELATKGWVVIRIWSHEFKKGVDRKSIRDLIRKKVADQQANIKEE